MCQRTCHLPTRKWNEKKLKKTAQKTEGGVVEILLVYLQLSKKNIENKQLKSNIFTHPDHHTKNPRQHSLSCFQHLLLAQSHHPNLLCALSHWHRTELQLHPGRDMQVQALAQGSKECTTAKEGTKVTFSQRQKNILTRQGLPMR